MSTNRHAPRVLGPAFLLWLGLMLWATAVPADVAPQEDEPAVDYETALGLEGLPIAGAPPAGFLPASLPPDRAIWDRTPIAVVLPVGVERRVDFPAPVSVGIPQGELPENLLRTQNVNASLYWLATKPFAPVRIQVREVESGFLYLIDLQARDGAPATPLVVMRPDGKDTTAAAPSMAPPPTGNDPYVTLTRYAAQQLYGPECMARSLPGVFRVPVPRAPLALLRGGAVTAEPLVSWSGTGHYVTAVKLTNRTPYPVTLDPRQLRGQWLAASFQHARLLPAGDEADTTCVYLVSKRPFAESAPAWITVAAAREGR